MNTLQMPKPSDILGFDNFNALLNTDRIYRRSARLARPGNDPVSVSESATESVSTTTSVPGFPPPSPTELSNILRNFINIEDDQSSNKSSELECEADDEDEGDDSSYSAHGGEMHMTRKPGERYTEHDFQFLEEAWLVPIEDEISEYTCNSSD